MYKDIRNTLDPFIEEQNINFRNEIPQKSQYKPEQSTPLYSRIKEEIPITQVAEQVGYSVKKNGRYYTLKEHDSVILYPETNSYYQFSTGTGGSNIDFLINFASMGKREAIENLKSQLSSSANIPASSKYIAQNKTFDKAEKGIKEKFVLPKAFESQYKRIFSYLTKSRCIDPNVVQKLIENKNNTKTGYIYEDERHNVVFVGRDENGKDAFATRRSTLTYSKFKGDVANSDQSIGWNINNKSNVLYVCEAPIDALSLMTLNNSDTTEYSYLATCGTAKEKSIYNFLNNNKEVEKVVLVNDDDKAGREADERISNYLQENYKEINVQVKKPVGCKDVNEQLQRMSKEKQNNSGTRSQGIKGVISVEV